MYTAVRSIMKIRAGTISHWSWSWTWLNNITYCFLFFQTPEISTGLYTSKQGATVARIITCIRKKLAILHLRCWLSRSMFLFYFWTHCKPGRIMCHNYKCKCHILGDLRLGFWLYPLSKQQDKNGSIPYIADWQSVYGTPISSHFLTCVDHHDLPPSLIVWASRLSALHLLISEAFCSEKGDCQQWIYKREGKQKGAGSKMCNFHTTRLMGEERRRQKGEREQEKGGGDESGEEAESMWGRTKRENKDSTLYLIYFSCICYIYISPLLHLPSQQKLILPPSLLLLSELVQR